MKLFLLAIVSCSLVSCTKYAYQVTSLPNESGHYVLVQTSAKKRGPASKVYDCKSYQQIIQEPAAVKTVWAPLCYEVDVKGPIKAPVAQEVRAEGK
jgi:hypothetical protein